SDVRVRITFIRTSPAGSDRFRALRLSMSEPIIAPAPRPLAPAMSPFRGLKGPSELEKPMAVPAPAVAARVTGEALSPPRQAPTVSTMISPGWRREDRDEGNNAAPACSSRAPALD